MDGRLVLCDIDGTLVDAGGAGLKALELAACEVFGSEGPELDLRGATDEGLVRGLFAHYGEEYDANRVAEFYGVYLAYLKTQLEEGRFVGRVLPGVVELLAGLRDQGAVLGLLTGNIARGAAIKVQHYGLDEFFSFGAYGDDHHDRNKLGPVALSRAREATGREFSGVDAIVLGDTPKDIACGKEIGAMTVCVATGSFGIGALREGGADLVFPSFADYGKCLGELTDLLADRVS